MLYLLDLDPPESTELSVELAEISTPSDAFGDKDLRPPLGGGLLQDSRAGGRVL